MRKLLFAIALVCGFHAHGQGIIFTAPLPHTNGAPTGNPSAQGARMRYDTVANELYTHVPGTGWVQYRQGIDRISGTIPPAYTPNKGQSDWAVNGANPPELYYYTGSVWLRANPVGTTYTAGEGIAIDGSTIRIDTLDRLTFNQSPTLGGGVGTFRWNDTDGTLDLGLKGGNVTLQLGQETVHRAVNKHGSTIANGEVVGVFGAQGNRISIRKASAAADSLSNSTFGIATEDISNNQEGFVTAQGLVRGLNTSGFTEGAPLYLSATTPGALTQTAPAAPAHTVLVGYCVRSHATVGSIWVEMQRGFNLGELHDVSTSAATNGQVLTYNSSTKVWSGATVADQSATNELQTLSQGSTTVTLSNGGGTVNVDPSTTNELNTGLSVGSGNLNLTDAGGTLSVPVTSIAPDQSATNEAQTLSVSGSSNPTVSLSTAGGAGGGSVQLQGGGSTTVTQSAGVVTVSSTGGSPAGSTGQVQFNNAGAFGASSNLFWDINNARLGIGAGGASPSSRLETWVGSTLADAATFLVASPAGSATRGGLMIRTNNPDIGGSSTVSLMGTNTSVWTNPAQGLSFRNDTRQFEFGSNTVFANQMSVDFPWLGASSIGNAEEVLWVKANATDVSLTAAKFVSSPYPPMVLQAKSIALHTKPSAAWPDFASGNTTAANQSLLIDENRNAVFGSGTPASKVDINATNGYAQLRLRTTYTPTSSSDALGNTGDTAWDANFFYIKTAAGWKRAALSTF